MYGQTLQNPTFGNTTTNTLKVKTNTTSATALEVGVLESDGVLNKMTPENLPINQPPHPINYSVTTSTLGAHLVGIDTRLGQIGQTTAGQTNRIYFTGDNTTVNSVVYFASSATGKGSTPSASPTNLVNGDDQKQYFAKDIISIAQPANTISAPGIYSGQLSVMVDSDIAQERYTVEVYKTNNLGVPISSGITGAPVGDLGVAVIAILDSSILDLSASAITNITVSGTLTEQLTLNTGERVRYHVSATKVGTAGSNVTFSVYYGSNHSSYYDVPVTTTTDGVVNKSVVSGLTTTNALNSLDARILGTATFLPVFTGSNSIGNSEIFKDGSNGYKTGTQNTTYGVGLSVSKLLTVINRHTFDDYSLINTVSPNEGYGTFDASTEMAGSLPNDHFNGYQSRLNYSSSSAMSGPNSAIYGLTGYLSQNRITGTGHITVAKGFFARDLGGASGTVDNLYGLHIDAQTKGSITNWDIHATGKNNHFGAVMIGAVPAQWNTVDALVNTGISNFSGLVKITSQLRISSPSNTVPVLQIGDYVGSFGWGVFESNTTGNFLIKSKNSGVVVDGFEIARNTGNIGFGGAPNSDKLNVVGNASGSVAASSTNHFMRKGEFDTAIVLKADLASPVFTGNPTSPTPTAGDNDTSIATTAFVTGAIATADAGYVKTTGNQSISGVKTFSESTGVAVNAIASASYSAILGQTATTSSAIQATTTSSTGAGVLSNIGVSGSGFAYVGQNNGSNTFTVNKTGDVVTNTVTLANVLKLKAYTVGTLPTGAVGDMAYVTDATAPTYNATVVGGGAIRVPVFYNGTNWTAH